MQSPSPPRTAAGLVWFRRDLRVADHHALAAALQECAQVHCVFVFDTQILESLPRADRRVEFIRESLVALDERLREVSRQRDAGLIVLHGAAATEIPALAQRLQVGAVYANHDDEPASLARDTRVRTSLAKARIAFQTSKDHVMFERREVLTKAGTPYTVFTPYKRAWLEKLAAHDLAAHDSAPGHGDGLSSRLAPRPEALRRAVPSLSSLGFERTNLAALDLAPGEAGAQRLLAAFEPRMAEYAAMRDFPAVNGTSWLGVHLRFGTVSVRELARRAHVNARRGQEGAATWLGELIWRDFFAQILANFPHVADAQGRPASFHEEYDRIEWETGARAKALLAAWCEGRTGYPIVDAAMAQINTTGFMHNRLRMIAASFLCKDLGVDWRLGERYFALHLNDYDLASNNGNWQWAASTGCDAQPWFRIFNPVTQGQRFDAQGEFVRRWLPQLAGLPDKAIHAPWTASTAHLAHAGLELGRDYPRPLVDHDEARAPTLKRYGVVKAAAR
jgi:deoxyribodipyrimidine photo-lyase